MMALYPYDQVTQTKPHCTRYQGQYLHARFRESQYPEEPLTNPMMRSTRPCNTESEMKYSAVRLVEKTRPSPSKSRVNPSLIYSDVISAYLASQLIWRGIGKTGCLDRCLMLRELMGIKILLHVDNGVRAGHKALGWWRPPPLLPRMTPYTVDCTV